MLAQVHLTPSIYLNISRTQEQTTEKPLLDNVKRVTFAEGTIFSEGRSQYPVEKLQELAEGRLLSRDIESAIEVNKRRGFGNIPFISSSREITPFSKKCLWLGITLFAGAVGGTCVFLSSSIRGRDTAIASSENNNLTNFDNVPPCSAYDNDLTTLSPPGTPASQMRRKTKIGVLAVSSELENIKEKLNKIPLEETLEKVNSFEESIKQMVNYNRMPTGKACILANAIKTFRDGELFSLIEELNKKRDRYESTSVLKIMTLAKIRQINEQLSIAWEISQKLYNMSLNLEKIHYQQYQDNFNG